eukprot:12941026-Ditylum_brightwellii.AAC.1
MAENTIHKEEQERLKETIMSEEEICIGSNGGLKTQDETYCWVNTTATNIMWANNGYVTGNRNLMETLRTE